MSDVTLAPILPVDADGEVVHPGDFVAQYAWCLDRADELLGEHGLSLDHAVTTYDFSTPATREVYRRTHRERKERLGGAGVFPGAGGILLDDVSQGAGHPGALVRLEVTASPEPLVGVNPGWARYDTLTYYPGVLAGRTLYMSGFAALDMETQLALHEGDLGAQTEATYAAILEVLAEAGAGPEHITRMTWYVTDKREYVASYRALGAAYREVIGRHFPAMTAVQVTALIEDRAKVEIEATAMVPDA